MRLIVHLGFHKTGSTYLQHLLNLNHDPLRASGVYYERQDDYPAHHLAAWDILRGDTLRLRTMLEAARAAGCHTTILSSEDLEGLIFDPAAVCAIEDEALASGVTQIEWHLCLRDPGEYFSSLYAELQHHVFADAAAMLFDVLRDGMIMMLDPLRGEGGTPFWCYCFDPHRYVAAFATRTEHPVFAHDYRDAHPYPGWRMIERVGALDAIRRIPGAEARNARLAAAAVQEGHRDQILRLLPDQAQRQMVLPLIQAHVAQSSASISGYAKVVSHVFAPSTEAALREFSPTAGGNSDPVEGSRARAA